MRSDRIPMLLVMVGYLAGGACGLDWGLYSPARHERLFPAASTWTPEDVASVVSQRVAQAALGADVDPNPTGAADVPVSLTRTLDDRAEIFARYLLYSGQPDEMISLRAISQMAPSSGQFDPRLYQYGGLFIYPYAGLLKLAALTGWIEERDRAYYLAHPHDFTRFYLVGRGMVLAWGVLGVWLAGAIAARLGGPRAAPVAAVLFAVLPVVVSLSHEAKPHLPGTVLMMAAVYGALRYHDTGLARHRFSMAAMCGLAVGMVLSSLWIVVLIPLVEWLVPSRFGERAARAVGAGAAAALAYFVTNPYVLVNLLTNRAVLASNLSNSTAMYAPGDSWAAWVSAASLMVAGSSIVVIGVGLFVCVALWGWDWRKTLIVLLPALVTFVQFTLLAEGKPGEYGRFALFPNVALCILAAAGVARFLIQKWYQTLIYAVILASPLAWGALDYFERFSEDLSPRNSRFEIATALEGVAGRTTGEHRPQVGVLRDPAPYGFPPIDFARWDVVRLPADVGQWPEDKAGWPEIVIVPLDGVEGVDVDEILRDGHYGAVVLPLPDDRARLTWASKPLLLLRTKKG